MRKRWVVPAVVAMCVALTAGACEERGKRDAPIDTRLQDNQAPFIVNYPDTFMNAALKCVGATLLISHTRPGPIVAVEQSSICAEGKAEEIGVPRVGRP